MHAYIHTYIQRLPVTGARAPLRYQERVHFTSLLGSVSVALYTVYCQEESGGIPSRAPTAGFRFHAHTCLEEAGSVGLVCSFEGTPGGHPSPSEVVLLAHHACSYLQGAVRPLQSRRHQGLPQRDVCAVMLCEHMFALGGTIAFGKTNKQCVPKLQNCTLR
jgi:hypothetical protein